MTMITRSYAIQPARSRSVNIEIKVPAGGAFATTAPNGQTVCNGLTQSIRAFARSSVARATVDEAEADYWLATVEDIKGPWGDGATKDEALSELEDAIVSWVELNVARGAGVPFALTAHVENLKSG
jgi:predicted RNase H-like HicB family nuclease